MKILDFIAKNSERFAEEWFKILRWILTISAIQLVSAKVDDLFVKSIPILSILVLWCYIYFGYCEQYINSLKPLKDKSIKNIIISSVFSLVVSGIFFVMATDISKMAYSLLEQTIKVVK